ncbi:MAG: RagB/SusD family nutrient uptake outer membrane protein, partial [Prevotella sp.]|nr:RagB/SusD family nutrient uptake outer membrane protein [Prevotella sp.]
MKLKNIFIKSGVALLMGASLSSCSDFLEIEPLNEIVLEKFWNEESDVENMIAGCYSALQAQVVVDRMMAWGEFRSDNLVGGTNVQNDSHLQNIFKENLNASNSYTSWGEFYDIINRCNTTIYYAPSVADKDPNFTKTELNASIAEASAIRDLCYFYLIRAFRDVPYTTIPYLDDTQKMNQPAVKFNLVLDSLIMDLEKVKDYAMVKYPEKKDYDQKGRITRDAIYAMLCDMYLWKKDYAKAVTYADLVI